LWFVRPPDRTAGSTAPDQQASPAARLAA